ncbi:MAG: hypothetical protein J2P34_12770 [Actinobacteria bacterium]|nr:hypothetical protein [Actinomycetota bacterium]
MRSVIVPLAVPSLQLRTPARASRAACELPVLGLACTLQPGNCGRIVQAVLARALAPGRPAGTVVLVLDAGTELEADVCAALRALANRLEAAGIMLRLAAARGQLREQLDSSGLAGRLGTGAIHPSLRAAVLSVYSELPGPGLVTREVQDCLLKPAEPIAPGGSTPGRRRSPGLQVAGHDPGTGQRPASDSAGHAGRFRRMRGPRRSMKLAG